MNDRARLGCAPAMFYCADRLKKNWLSQDLKTLDTDQSLGTACISQYRLISLFPTDEHIVGAIYVIEGSTLGGTVLSRHFTKTLGVTPDAGLCFFAGYGPGTKDKWNDTLRYLETCEKKYLSHTNIIAGAKRMFLLLAQHLANAPRQDCP